MTCGRTGEVLPNGRPGVAPGIRTGSIAGRKQECLQWSLSFSECLMIASCANSYTAAYNINALSKSAFQKEMLATSAPLCSAMRLTSIFPMEHFVFARFPKDY